MKTCSRSHSLHRIVFALLLIIIGVVFVCANIGVIQPEWKSVLISWQMLLVFIGLIMLSDRSLISGSIFLFVGAFFIMPKLSFLLPSWSVVNSNFVNTYWPVLLIAVGVVILLFGSTKRYWNKHAHCYTHIIGAECGDVEVEDTAVTDDGKINYRFMFSGAKNVFLDPVFNGGTIDVTFGGVELDLRRTALPEGTTKLFISATFGGVVLSIPHTWNVEIQNQSMLGGFEDHRWKDKDSIDFSRKLLVVAKCTLGGGEIKE